jgi:DNA-binding SARP family transcriptional activator/ABC-type transport system substrate-binding protein/streptogramin lyase
MEFRLLGPLEVVRDDSPIPLGGARQRALLAFLLLHANEVVSRDRLIDALLGERPPESAAHILDQQLFRLRKALEPDELLVRRPGGYALEVDAEQVDVRRFKRLLEEARQANAAGHSRAALEALDAALALWRGPALADVAYEDFARIEIDRLEELRLVALEARVDAELALGRHDTAISELEALTARHPLRERPRAQTMLALYRAGRQAEALQVYAETRRRLVDELGIEPGPALRELEQAILRHDPSLSPARTPAARTRRGVLSAVAILVAAGIAASVVLLTQGGTENARALPAAESDVLLAARSGTILHQAAVSGTVRVRFGFGSVWSVSRDGELSRIDPQTGKAVALLGLGITPSGLAAGAGSIWVTDADSPTLLRIDPSLNPPVVADRIRLPKAGTDETQDVLVAAGSVWVAHGGFNPGAWVERLDPRTGRVLHRIPILSGEATALAFADGDLWVASRPAGDVRTIDTSTNSIVRKVHLKEGTCCIAAGGGYAWVAVNPDGVVWKLAGDGSVVTTTKLPARIDSLVYRDGAVWIADGEAGEIVRVDPTTNERRVYPLGHHVAGIDIRDGVVAIGLRQSAEDATAGLAGRIVRVAVKGDTLFRSGAATDPSLYSPWDGPQNEFHYATCAKLLNYRDAEGDAGRRLVPEVAASWPSISHGGRSYTFTIRTGYRFSPPSNEPVTAESFRHEIERVLSPKYDYVDPDLFTFVGAAAYHEGRAAHVAGLRVRGNRLVIRLRRPLPDLPRLLALSWACAVPTSTPVTSHGIEAPIPSAGPYYLTANTDSVAVLRRNPNYHGPRPQHLDAIVFRFGVPPANAAVQIARGRYDDVAEFDAALAPTTSAARAAGRRYRLTPEATADVHMLALNAMRPVFRDAALRRAVEYALDRRALAAIDTAIPATRLLSPRLIGYEAAQSYPLRADLRRARALMRGRRVHVVFATFDPAVDSRTAAFARAVREQLAAIGIGVTILPLTNYDWENGTVAAKMARADIAWAPGEAPNGDTVDYLGQLAYLPRGDRAALEQIARLTGPARDAQAAALAAKIERQVLYAVYEQSAVPELVSPRVGCIVHQPEYEGVDLTALCLRKGD